MNSTFCNKTLPKRATPAGSLKWILAPSFQLSARNRGGSREGVGIDWVCWCVLICAWCVRGLPHSRASQSLATRDRREPPHPQPAARALCVGTRAKQLRARVDGEDGIDAALLRIAPPLTHRVFQREPLRALPRWRLQRVETNEPRHLLSGRVDSGEGEVGHAVRHARPRHLHSGRVRF